MTRKKDAIQRASPENEKTIESRYDLSLLTHSQRIAFVRRKAGKTFREIADELLITVEGARQNYRRAVWVFKHYEREKEQHRMDMLSVEYPITRKQLLLIAQALEIMQQQAHFKGYITLHGRKVEYDDREVGSLLEQTNKILEDTKVKITDIEE